MGNRLVYCPESPSTEWVHPPKIIYLFSAFNILPGAGSYVYNLVMLFIAVRWPSLAFVPNKTDQKRLKSTYPALIIIIVCTQIGQDGDTTKPDRSEALDLTTIRLPIGDNTIDSQMPATSDEGKASTRFTSQEW